MRALRRTAAGASSRPPPTARRPADPRADTGEIRVPAGSAAHAATRPPGRSGSGHYPNQLAVDIHMPGTCGSNYLTEDDLQNLHISNNDAARVPVGPTAIGQSRYFTDNQPLSGSRRRRRQPRDRHAMPLPKTCRRTSSMTSRQSLLHSESYSWPAMTAACNWNVEAHSDRQR